VTTIVSPASSNNPDDFDVAKLALPTAQPAKVVAGVGDEIDLAAITIRSNHIAKGATRQILNEVPVGRPGNSDWVWVFYDPAYRLECAVYEPKSTTSTSKGRTHLVTPAVVEKMKFERGIRNVEIFTFVDRHGNLGLWPVGFPNEERENAWIDSARDAAINHAGKWINIRSDLTANRYLLSEPISPLPAPAAPALPLSKLLAIAFKGRVIDSVDHPLMRELRGDFS
jgi:hypothetical protein